MIVFGANMAIEGIQDLWHVINGDLDVESVNLIKEATGHKADNVVDLTELAVSVGSAKAVSKTTSKAFSEASSKLKDALGKAKKVGTAISDEARAMAKSARLAVRKQLLRFRKPKRAATRVDLDGLMKEYRIPSTLSEEQRAACDAVGLEMKYSLSEIEEIKVSNLDLVKNGIFPHSDPNSYYSYNELKRLISDTQLSGKSVGFEAHHLLEKQYASKFGVNKGDIISVALTPKWHRGVNGEKILFSGVNINAQIETELMKITNCNSRISANKVATLEQIWQAHRNVYEKIGCVDWAKAVYEAYVRVKEIKY